MSLLRQGIEAASSGGNVLPDAGNVVIYTPLTSDLVSTIGSNPTWSRGSNSTYGATPTTLGTKTGVQALIPEYAFNDPITGIGGFGFYPAAKNWLPRSQEFDDAVWVAIGGGAATANTTNSPFGTLTADTISGSTAGDGLEQDGGFAAASLSVLFSVYMKTSSGTAVVKIRVRDNPEGQAGETTAYLTTTWQRVQVYKEFVSATGNVFVQIIVDNSSNVRAFGAMLEKRFDGGSYDVGLKETPCPYIPTTSGTGTRDGDEITYPAADIDLCQPKGSISLWVNKIYDMTQSAAGNGHYLFSVSNEQFTLIFQGVGHTMNLWMGNSFVGSSPGGTAPGRYLWTHVGVTWDTDADLYNLYLNGVLVKNFAVAKSPWSTGHDFYLCKRSDYTNQDMTLSRYAHFALWKNILTPSQMAQAYRATLMPQATFSTGLLFEASLGYSLAATTGNCNYSYQRKGGMSYYDSETTIAAVTDGVPADTSYVLNASTGAAGLSITPTRTNSILQSEDIGTTWAAVGTPVISGSAGTFLGTMNYGTITAVLANDGITQTVATAAANTKWVGSFYVQRDGGSDVTGVLTIEGASGGTPETATVAFTATADVTRVYLYKSFTGSATGNVKMKITVDNPLAVIRVGGFQCELHDGTTDAPLTKVPTPYIKTTTGAVKGYLPILAYESAGNINPKKGTAIFWINPSFGSADIAPGEGPTILGFPGHTTGFIFRFLQAGELVFTYDALWPTGSTVSETISFNAFTWMQIACSWDTENGDIRIYKNGDLIAVTVLSSPKMLPFTPLKMFIGTDVFAGPTDTFNGLFDLVRIYGEQDDQLVLDNFNTFKANYGL